MVSAVKSVIAVASVVAVAAIGYAAYFDYQRRNNPQFRKKIKKSKLSVQKKEAAQLRAKEEQLMESLAKALEMVKDEVFPTSPEDREKFFMAKLQQGENVFRAGGAVEEAAAHFYCAVKIYPNQVDLLMVLQKTVPQDIVSLVYAMISTEDQKHQHKYFDSLCIKYPTVAVKPFQVQGLDGKHKVVMSLAAARDLEADELIYIEDPTISVLNKSMETSLTRCTNCTERLPDSCSGDLEKMICCKLCQEKAVFCSTSCLERAVNEYHLVLCPGNSQNEGAQKLYNYCITQNETYCWMVAKFIARMVWKQTVIAQASNKDTPSEGDIMPEWEHLERLPVYDMPITEELQNEAQLVRDALKFAAPGAEDFLTTERYATIKGNMMYNSYGLYDDNDAIIKAKEGEIVPRSSSEHIYGAGLYFVTSYAAHSCTSNAEVTFKSSPTRRHKYKADPVNTSCSPKLILRSKQAIKKNDRITVSYVPQSYGIEDRWTRLLRVWGEGCHCIKCQREEKELKQ